MGKVKLMKEEIVTKSLSIVPLLYIFLMALWENIGFYIFGL